MGEIIFHIFLLVVMGVFYKGTLDINTARMTDPIGPAGFPKAIIIVAVLLIIPSLIKAIKKYNETKGEKKGKVKELDPGFLALLGVIITFVLSIRFVGFWFGALVIISSVMWILNERKPIRLITTTVVGALVFTFVFGKILSIPLPRGYGFFEMISYYIY